MSDPKPVTSPPSGSAKRLGLRRSDPAPQHTATTVTVTPQPVQAPPPLSPPIPPGLPPALSWPVPTGPAPAPVLLAGTAAGLSAAALLPLDRPGVGWLLSALVAAGGVVALHRRWSPMAAGWAVMALALLGTGALHASEWMFTLCVLTALVTGSLAVNGGRSVGDLLFGAVAVLAAALRSIPWVTQGLAGLRPHRRGHAPLARTLLVSAVLLVVFVPLLASADAAFATLLSTLVPDADGGAVFRWVFLFLLVGLGTVGACYLLVSPPSPKQATRGARRTVGRREWVVPVGLLVVLFAAFVGVQLANLFGGHDYVLRTAGLTSSEYARSGFWQLLAVTVLTLGVIGVTARLASVRTSADRAWLRGVLGALAGLTLVIVASALSRMWSYQQAYGFTVLRLLVEVCEVWLGVVYLLVIAAGVRLRTDWLPRAVVGTGVAALLVVAALNPDRFIAERNVARWQATGDIDTYYLSRLSADAVPVLAQLPSDLRTCALDPIARRARAESPDDWRSWNLGRAQARDVLATVPLLGRDQDCGYDYTRSGELGPR